MSQDIIDSHKDALISALRPIYADGIVCKPGARVSNGRGGFITSATSDLPAQVKKEDDREALARINVSPDMSVVYVLNTLGEDVLEGWGIEYKGVSYLVKEVTLDPVETAFECVCEDAS